jgi:hypothetical protein
MCSKSVAVRADDIALGRLGQDARLSRAPDQPSHADRLRRRISMVEVHRAGWEASTAIGTGDIPQGVQESRVEAPSRPPAVDVSRSSSGGALPSQPLAVPDPGSDPMAVRADHIAFRGLIQEPDARHQHRPALGQPEGLGRGIPMIEIHLMRGESPATVRARDSTKVPQEFERSGLARADTGKLALAVPRVIRHIRFTLGPGRRHARILEQVFCKPIRSISTASRRTYPPPNASASASASWASGVASVSCRPWGTSWAECRTAVAATCAGDA